MKKTKDTTHQYFILHSAMSERLKESKIDIIKEIMPPTPNPNCFEGYDPSYWVLKFKNKLDLTRFYLTTNLSDWIVTE